MKRKMTIEEIEHSIKSHINNSFYGMNPDLSKRNINSIDNDEFRNKLKEEIEKLNKEQNNG